MKLIGRFIFANRKFYLGAGLFLLVFLGGAASQVSAADCSGNSIIKCGFTSKTDFISTVQGNTSKSRSDLTAIYANYGLIPADYSRFVASARSGIAYKSDNTIVVDGQVVATNVRSVGRDLGPQGTGAFSTKIPGAGTVYGNTNDKAFGSSQLPVTVMFNDKGEVEFAVLNDCGNPIYGDNTHPAYGCNLLHKSQVTGKDRMFKFTTDANAGNNAAITKVVYTFGDGGSHTEYGPSSPSAPVYHSYARDGNYTAKVTVYVSLPGKQSIQVTSADCQTVVVVASPFYQCIQLAAATIGSSKYQYKYILTGKAGNKATLTTADFKFGDGKFVNGIKVNGVTATATHTYTKDGSFQASATFHVTLPDGKHTTVTAPGCTHKVPVAIPYYSCDQLGGAILDASKYSYSFTVSASFGNGVTFKSADFDFGDKKSTKNLKPKGRLVTTTHTYATAGKYRATATLHFSLNGGVKDVKCTATLSPTQPPTPECKPGVPEGDEMCNPCQYDSTIPASDTENCVAPATNLPNTGAGDVIAIFGAAAVGGFLIFRQFIYKKHAVAGVSTMTSEGMFVGPVVSEETGVIVSHHAKQKRHARTHRNAVKPLHHPTYQHPHRFRPSEHEDEE